MTLREKWIIQINQILPYFEYIQLKKHRNNFSKSIWLQYNMISVWIKRRIRPFYFNIFSMVKQIIRGSIFSIYCYEVMWNTFEFCISRQKDGDNALVIVISIMGDENDDDDHLVLCLSWIVLTHYFLLMHFYRLLLYFALCLPTIM